MRLPISKPERPHLLRFVLTFSAIVITWAILHDIHLIQIEPRHFTEFHPPILPLESPILLATQYAIIATTGPALAFGFLAYHACRTGNRQKLSIPLAALGFTTLLTLVELLLRTIGNHARAQYQTHQTTLLPTFLHPDLTPNLIYTQTINLTAYLIAPTIGSLYLLALHLTRKPISKKCASHQDPRT